MSETEVALMVARVEAMGADLHDIKSTLKEVASAMNRMSLIEERQTNQSSAIERAFNSISKIGDRLQALELAQPIQKQSSDIVQKVVGYILAAALSSGATALVVHRPTTPTQVQQSSAPH